MKSRYPRLLMPAAVLVIAVVILVGACGGSTQTAKTPPSSATKSGSIVFGGLVDYPMTFTVLDMDYMNWVTMTAEHPELGAKEYEGVRLSDIFSYVGVRSDATAVVVTAADGSTAEIPLADIAGKEAMIALGEDDTLDAVMPGLGGEAWVKDIVSMELR